MLDNLNFYNFMHRQILVLIALFAGTGITYVVIGHLYSSYVPEISWYLLLLLVSLWGYRLYKAYSNNKYSIEEKEKWLNKLRYFLFIYFSTWTIIFFIYVSRDIIELHYLAITTQLGVAVVSATILVSEKKLALFVLSSSMLPITIYLIVVGQPFSYFIAILSIVLGWVLLYASRNTYSYLQKSKFQAYHDYLTKLGNRRYLIELLDDAIKMQEQDKQYMALLLIDLDHFKTINDTLGHDVGDTLLCEVADRMSEITKEYSCSISRLGGDEFCILSTPNKDKDICIANAMSFAQELINSIKRTYIIEDHHLYISASIGVSLIDSPKIKANVFLKEADIAMYEAKLNGRDGVMLFDNELSIRVEKKLEIERLLHFALENKEISLMYQPQLNLQGNIIGCEVLVRWNNEFLGFVPPDEFIPISEKTGLILELGQYILEESFKTLKEWDQKGIDLQQLSINISVRQIYNNNFVSDVQSLCEQYLTPELCSKLMFEITETIVAEDMDKLIKTINKIKELGIRFSMDDFGTGYSSLNYLRKIPINEIKIDKSFVFELDNIKEDKYMIKTIINIAKNLNLRIVAEGVETQMQKEFLTQEKCDILQGYYFSKPIKKDEFEELVNKIK